MNFKTPSFLNRLTRPAKNKLLVVAVAVVGVLTVGLVAYAAVPAVVFEAESGTLSGSASVMSDPNASGGSGVLFGAGGSGFPANIPSNFNVNDHLATQTPPESTANEPSGNFRTICRFSHLDYADPILFPGQENTGHLHSFFGNTTAGAHSTWESLRTTGNSTCEGGPINRSSYWVPAMFDGNGDVVPFELVIVYYKSVASGGTFQQQVDEIQNVTPLPNALRYIAGFTPAGGPTNRGFSWRCEDGSGKGNRIPVGGCPQGMAILGAITFPTCWDGETLTTETGRGHVVYKFLDPQGSGRQICPDTHPIILPELTETVLWPWAPDMADWHLSSDVMWDTSPGASLHADWFGAWDHDIMMRWHENCLVGMRNSNNGNLCDGQRLSGVGGWSSARISGWTPMP